MSKDSRLKHRCSRYNLKPVKVRGVHRRRFLTDFSVPMLRTIPRSAIKTIPDDFGKVRRKATALFRIRLAIFAKRNARRFRRSRFAEAAQ